VGPDLQAQRVAADVPSGRRGLSLVTRRRWGIGLLCLGVVLLIPGLIVFVQTAGGVTPALLVSLVLLLVGWWIREEDTPPLPPPPPSPESPEQKER
jgi:uncharacterized membrane protein